MVSSTSFLTVLFFLVVSLAVEKLDPLDRLFWTGLTGTRQNIFVSKLPKLIAGSQNPDVLVLGSSVSLYPAVRADDELAGRKARWDFWYERTKILPYDKAIYLEHHLSKWANHAVSVSNASVAGSLVSDQYMILRKYLASGKTPKMVVVCLSPRDFLDNARTELDKTPTHTILNEWSTLAERLEQGAPWRSVVDEGIGQFFGYYKHRQEYSDFFTRLAARNLNHPVSLHEATQIVEPAQALADPNGKAGRNTFFNPVDKPIFERPTNTLYHLSEYKEMYLPFNKAQFAAQSEYFEKFLQLAAQRGVPVTVVNTPLPRENLNLLPERLHDKYRNTLAAACRKTNATLLEPDAGEPYDTAQDFEDASHMSTSGSIKFWDAIVDSIRNNPRAIAQLRADAKVY